MEGNYLGTEPQESNRSTGVDFINRELNAGNTVNVNQHDFTEIRPCL